MRTALSTRRSGSTAISLAVTVTISLASPALAQDGEGIACEFSPIYVSPTWGPPAVHPAPIGHDFIDVTLGYQNLVALRADGTIVVIGSKEGNMLSPPAPTPGNPFIRVFAGSKFGVAMRSDRTLVGWGTSTADLNKPPPGNFMDVTCGYANGLGLRDDGTLVAWGYPYPYAGPPIYGSMLDVPPGKFKAIACGGYHFLALREDNKLIGWGDQFGSMEGAPTGEFVSVGAALGHNFAIRAGGTIVGWGGGDAFGLESEVPPGPFVAIDSDMFMFTAAALRADGSIALWGKGMKEGFKPPEGVFSKVSVTSVAVVGLGAQSCYADCQADGWLDVDDFICFQTLFAIGESWADCDGDGQLLIDDFLCFQTAFAVGC